MRSFKIGTYNDVHLCTEIPTSVVTFTKNMDMLNERELDLLINLGDCIMDGSTHSSAKVADDWRNFKHIAIDRAKHETIHVPGNHDFFSWVKKLPVRSVETEVAFEQLKMQEVQTKRLNQDWLLIALNSSQKSTLHHERGYDAKFSNEQFAKLEKLLRENAMQDKTKHVLIATHIPILTVTSFMDRRQTSSQRQYELPNNHMHSDSYDIVQLLSKYEQVKLCISGHQHMVDEVVYNGIKFICCGSLCGQWWTKETYRGHNAGNMFFELYEDGSTTHHYEAFKHVHEDGKNTSLVFGRTYLFEREKLNKEFGIQRQNDDYTIVKRKELEIVNKFMNSDADVLNKFAEFLKNVQ